MHKNRAGVDLGFVQFDGGSVGDRWKQSIPDSIFQFNVFFPLTPYFYIEIKPIKKEVYYAS